MIDYETYCKIRDHRDRQGLSITQTAQALGLHPETVSKWSRRERYEQRAPVKRGSQLDPYKSHIVRWLEAHSSAPSKSSNGCGKPDTAVD